MRKEEKEELVDMANCFSRAFHLLYVLGRGADEQANAEEIQLLKAYHSEMAFALEYLADTLNQRIQDFWDIIEKISEDDEVCGVAISEEEKSVLEIYHNLDDVETLESLLRGFRNGYKYRNKGILENAESI